MAKITFRAIEEGDLQTLQRWRNSEQVMPYCRQYRPLSKKDMSNWFEGLTKDKEYNLTNDLFIIEKDYVPIGVGGFVRIDWRNRKAEVSFYVADSSNCDKETLCGSLLQLIHYGLSTLNLWKIYFPCYEFNPLLKVYEEVMTREYVAKKEYFWEGKYWDRIILVRYADECV